MIKTEIAQIRYQLTIQANDCLNSTVQGPRARITSLPLVVRGLRIIFKLNYDVTRTDVFHREKLKNNNRIRKDCLFNAHVASRFRTIRHPLHQNRCTF